MTQPCRHRWGAWSPAWHEPGHGWWRKRECRVCGFTEYGRDTAIPAGRDAEVVRTIPAQRGATPDTATWHEDRDMGDEQR